MTIEELKEKHGPQEEEEPNQGGSKCLLNFCFLIFTIFFFGICALVANKGTAVLPEH